jgi:hypothetical protein
MSRPFPRSLAIAIAAVSVCLSGLSRGQAGTIPTFRSGQDVALRDNPRARSHASSAAADSTIPPDIVTAHGIYTQYFRVPNLNLPGYLRVQLSTDALFTGRLFLGGQLIAQLQGELGEEQVFATTFNDSKGVEVAYNVTLNLDLAEGGSDLIGTLDVAEIDAPPAEVNTAELLLRPRLLDSGHAGNYTVALPPDLGGAPRPTRPQKGRISSLSPVAKRPAALGGCGYGLLRVNKFGALHSVAVLADGRKVSFGGYLDANSNVALFSQLYTSGSRPPNDTGDNYGYIGGVLRFRDRPHHDALALLRWVRPSAADRRSDALTGFSIFQPALVSRYVKFDDRLSVLDGTHEERRETEITLVDGGLRSSIDSKGTVEADKVKGDRPDFYANFATDYGLFHGHFDHPGPHAAVDLRGVVLQKQGCAYGQFFDRFGCSGSVVIKQAASSSSSSEDQ